MTKKLVQYEDKIKSKPSPNHKLNVAAKGKKITNITT